MFHIPSKAITSIFTVFNQYEQILFQKALVTNDPAELKEQLKLVFINRFRKKCFAMPVILYTDRCCDDRDFLDCLMRELRLVDPFFEVEMGEESPQSANPLDVLSLPAEKAPTHVLTSDTDTLNVVCDIIRSKAHDGPQHLGFDIEYNPAFIPAADGPNVAPATLQLATLDGDSWVFSLFENGRKKEKLPNSLASLLTDNRFTFVGDITRLEKHYTNVSSSDIQVLDLGETAVIRGYTVKSKSLEMLSRQFCNFNLSKDSRICLSNWTLGKKLTVAQIRYAALDAYASALVFSNITSKCDPRSEPIPKVLAPESKVFAFTKSDAECVARATVVEYDEPKWGSLQMTTSRSKRVVLRLDTILNDSAMAMYRQKEDKVIKPLRDLHSQLVLWDLAHVRVETLESLAWVESVSRNSDPIVHENGHFVGHSDCLFPMSGTVVGLEETDLDEGHCLDECDDEESDDCSENDGDIYSEERPDGFVIKVRLDCFHAMNRINKTLLKAHGAYKPFMARLRDAFFLVCEEEMKAVEDALRASGMNEGDIKLKKENDWAFFLKYCRRLIPSKEELLKRFDRVCQEFQDILDSKTNEPLFRTKTRHEVKKLQQHIINGCLSDVPDFPLYFLEGRTSQGLPKYRCARGTNSNEGYHRHMRKLLHHYASSPKLLHLLLLEFNFRWNIRMAVKNRGLPDEYGGFYSHYVLEEINRNSSGFVVHSPYSAWKSPMDYEDTLERFGLRRSAFADEDSLLFNSVAEDAEFKNGTKSQQDFANLIGFKKIGMGNVSNKAEKEKFESDLVRWMAEPKVRNEINFDGWAFEWSTFVDSMENGTVPLIHGLRRKTSKHLKDCYNKRVEKANTGNTLAPARAAIALLRSSRPMHPSLTPNDSAVLIPSPIEEKLEHLKSRRSMSLDIDTSSQALLGALRSPLSTTNPLSPRTPLAKNIDPSSNDLLLPLPTTTVMSPSASTAFKLPLTSRYLMRHAANWPENPVFLVTMYFLLNLGITLYNKVILKFFQFKFPWLLTAIHSLLTYAGCVALIKGFKTITPQVPLDKRRDQLIVLVFSVLYTVNIAVSNISLGMVSVPFHQIIRSTNPAVTIFLEWLVLSKWKQGVGVDVGSSLFIVIFGVGLATYGSYKSTMWGFLVTFLGTVLSAMKGISTNTLLAGNGLKFHPIELLWRMSGLSFLQCFYISWVTGELDKCLVLISKLVVGWRTEQASFWLNPTWLVGAVLVNGAMAFFLNYVSFSANKKVGALSIAVAGNVKQAMTLGLSVWIFGDVIGAVNGAGILLTLVGGAWYSMIGVAKKAAKGQN
ncbi:UNVERIFIED_CONTAM: UAA transporter [Siphonaria sp. JEL0065]|nr:UAA transporter [Siphonaria sp. JEL0065]